MKRSPHGQKGGLDLDRHQPNPGLKELTIEMGDADVYVNMARRLPLANGHVLYEAVLTDPQGSRAIYVDQDDVVECLRHAFLDTSPERVAQAAQAREIKRPGRPRELHKRGPQS